MGAREQFLHPEEYSEKPPLAEGSPEEDYILTHANYLLRNPLRYVGLLLLNVFSLVVLFIWAGTLLADYALLPVLLRLQFGAEWLSDVVSAVDRAPAIALVTVLASSVWVILRFLYADGGWRRWLTLPGLAGLTVTCQPVLQAAASQETWWYIRSIVGVSAALVILLLALAWCAWLARRSGITGHVARGINTVAVLSPRFLGFVLLVWCAVWWYRLLAPALLMPADIGTMSLAGLAFVMSLFGGLLFSYVPHRASLHREYRRRLESCFAVRRSGGAAVRADDPLLSDLAPLQETPARSPRLLVCATANVHVRLPGRGRFTFVPFVMSQDVCGVPGQQGAVFATRQLELGQEPAGIATRRKEPLLTLFTAVATTGAAVGPSMGRYTLPSLRPLLAALNIRLGRWFPNPFSSRSRRAVCSRTTAGRFDKAGRLGPGYDELVPEMLGFDGPRVYVSDGGHYDNLGLIALLRAKCAEIWCVDASPEAAGESAELRRVFALAREEMDIICEVDLDRFAATPDGTYLSTHSIGRVRYPDGSFARLAVVKLGLSRESPELFTQAIAFGPWIPAPSHLPETVVQR